MSSSITGLAYVCAPSPVADWSHWGLCVCGAGLCQRQQYSCSLVVKGNSKGDPVLPKEVS